MMRAAIVLVLVGSRPYVASCFGYESIYPPIMVSQLAAIFSEHGTMASTMMTAFSTGWLFDGTLVLDDVRALAYTQMLAASRRSRSSRPSSSSRTTSSASSTSSTRP